MRTQVRRRHAGQRIQDGCSRRSHGRCRLGSAAASVAAAVIAVTVPHLEHERVSVPRGTDRVAAG
jgi:hypothetical protein